MGFHKIIAHKIWKIREEICMEGSAEHDWWLAGKYIEEHKGLPFAYVHLYNWVMVEETR